MGQTACNQILCTTAKQKSLNDDDLPDPSSSSNQISSLYFRNKLHFCVATIVYKSRPRRFSFQNKLQLAFLQLLPFLLHSLLLISRCFAIFPSFFLRFSVELQTTIGQCRTPFWLGHGTTKVDWGEEMDNFFDPSMEQQDLHNSTVNSWKLHHYCIYYWPRTRWYCCNLPLNFSSSTFFLFYRMMSTVQSVNLSSFVPVKRRNLGQPPFVHFLPDLF